MPTNPPSTSSFFIRVADWWAYHPPGPAVNLTDAHIVSAIRLGCVPQTIEHNEAIACNHAHWIEAFVAFVGRCSCVAGDQEEIGA